MSAGFSAATNYFGSVSGLTIKSSSDGKTSSLAEAQNEYGDTATSDVYGTVMAPSCEYAVTGTVNLSSISLGKVFSVGTGADAVKVMLTSVSVRTAAATPPTVTMSGVQVESGATDKRLYALTGTVTPRAKSQDVCGAFTASASFTAIDTTFSVDPHVQTIGGNPVVGDCSHGKVEVQATMTDGTGTGAITASATGGFTVTAVPNSSAPDADYITRQATATKFLTGSEGGNVQSND